jgi:UDP-N-acetylmuramoyl-L-alanyl-D-glutamate--2,6-diaminopimelate ligase
VKLTELLAGHDHTILQGDPEIPITAGVSIDVDRVAPGSLYLALPGHREGGPESIPSAVARGAVALIVDRASADLAAAVRASGICVAMVSDTRVAASLASARYFGEPGRQMDMIAITGTNGKTSISYLVESLLRLSVGAKAGVIGTSGSRIGDELIPMPPSALSTPEAPDLQFVLGHMRDQGVGSVVLEATSMGLLTHRADHCFLDVGIFTNLTQDHLDDHGTMANYRDAKLRLFGGLCRQAVINLDDPVSTDILRLMPTATTYAVDTEADYWATDLIIDAAGTSFVLHHGGRGYPAFIPIPGRYAVSNALAAIGACHILGHRLSGLVAALAMVPPIPGRFERFVAPSGTSVVVDYAHSPDSLAKVLSTIRDFATGRVITVFGCGGDRDATKRAEMGQIAGTFSDLCILTSDNPRHEDPETIMDQVVPGLLLTATPYERFADRKLAISRALAAAGPDDVVLIAGKGSEPFQIVGDLLLPFSDMATVRDVASRPLIGRTLITGSGTEAAVVA